MRLTVALIVCLLTGSPAFAWVDNRQCWPADVALTEGLVIELDPVGPTFYTNANLLNVYGAHWGGICRDLWYGLNLTDALDALQEGLIDNGPAQRLPGKPAQAWEDRVPVLIQRCLTGTAHSIYVSLVTLASANTAHIGLLNNYLANGSLGQALHDRWMIYAVAESLIVNAKLANVALRCF